MLIKIKKGLDVPLTGEPERSIHDGPQVSSVALVGYDYRGRKPQLLVEEGQRVKLGEPISREKKAPEILATAPGTGVVTSIGRGQKRFLQSVAIRLEGDEEESFNSYSREQLGSLDGEQVRKDLLVSGMWLTLRTRPYSKTPNPEDEARALFINAMDSNPLAPDPTIVIGEQEAAFKDGLTVLSRITDGRMYLCKRPSASVPTPELSQLQVAEFAGPHPAGLVGTHIHFLAPVGAGRSVWHIGYQDVIAIGKLFTTGRFYTERVVALAGPMVKEPRLLRTRVGANTNQLVAGQLHGGEARVISGSVLSGRRAAGSTTYLGRFHNQISVLAEGRGREFLGWTTPGGNKFSATRVFTSALAKGRRFALTTNQYGSERAMVPIGVHDDIMPLDILTTPLLKALLVRDTDSAQQLGCLELDEEDLALCSFVDPSKHDFGPVLRENLETIEREG